MMQAFNMRVGANAVIIRDDHILLIAFNDDLGGFHYNLPGGGLQPGETAQDALRREVCEEASAEVEVGPLWLITEYEPIRSDNRYGAPPKLSLIFLCQLKPECVPHLPNTPDPHQIGVHWLPLADLPNAPLLPSIGSDLIRIYQNDPAAQRYILI